MKKILLFLIIGSITTIITVGKIINPTISEKRIVEAQKFINTNHYNSDYCIFVDFSSYSGSNRLMIYDFKTNKIIYSCKCAHGNDGSEKTMEATEKSFSNIKGSHKSSLGKYRIGKKRKINKVDGSFDISMFNIPCYEMHGLENTNSNAYSRGILIHPGPSINNIPLPMFPWQSFGCFSIPINSFNKLSYYIDNSKLPILLFAYYK